jgi:hypothetical protein
MKTLRILCALLLFGCTFTPQQQELILNAVTIANVAATAAATTFGGPAAGQLASAGLSALSVVLQGYIGKNVPKVVVASSPGVGIVGPKVAELIPDNKPVTQDMVNAVNRAAVIAKDLKPADIKPAQ